MGLIEQNILKQAILSKQPVPDRIANKPILKKGLELYLDAFYDLDLERDYSFGASNIKWSSIANYAQFNNFDSEQIEMLFYFIRRMDNVRVKNLNKNNKSNE